MSDSRCRGCSAPIRWATFKGKPMALDLPPVVAFDIPSRRRPAAPDPDAYVICGNEAVFVQEGDRARHRLMYTAHARSCTNPPRVYAPRATARTAVRRAMASLEGVKTRFVDRRGSS